MADVVYTVQVQLGTTGSLSASLTDMGVKAAGLDSAFRGIGDTVSDVSVKLGSMIEGAVDSVANLALGMAKVGAVAAFGIATYGVAKLNNELEQTTISLGAIAQAQGFSKTFEQGFGLAQEQIAKMKQDVKTLPGDLGQLSNIMKMIATPAARGGAGLDEIRTLAGKTMLTATILGVQQDMAAREMANLLAGRAGAHNILGGRLGLLGAEAKQFNALSPEARLHRINEELAKYSGAADRFGHSFIAQWTTLKDNIKYGMLAEATSPLFERVKSSLESLNGYIDTHQDKIKELTSLIGRRLVDAWDAVIERFKAIEPIIARIADRIIHLKPGEIFGKLEKGGEVLLDAKLLGMALQTGGKAIGGFSAAAEGVEGAAALGAGVGVLAVGAVAAAGAVDSLTNATAYYHTETTALAKQLSTDLPHTLHDVAEAAKPAGSALRQFGDYLGLGLLEDIQAASNAVDMLANAFRSVSGFFGNFSSQLESFDDTLARSKFKSSLDVPGPIKDIGTYDLGLAVHELSKGIARDNARARPGAGGGGGGTHIQKVEIVVSSNQDPSMIARLVEARLSELSRFPRASRSVTNYSAVRSNG